MAARRATDHQAGTPGGQGGALDSASGSPTGRNAADMPVSAAAAEAWREMRADPPDQGGVTVEAFLPEHKRSMYCGQVRADHIGSPTRMDTVCRSIRLKWDKVHAGWP